MQSDPVPKLGASGVLPDCDHGPFSLSKEPRRFQPTAEAALDDIEATAAEVVQRPGAYGNVDIIDSSLIHIELILDSSVPSDINCWGHFSRIPQLHPTPRARRVIRSSWCPC